jgi:L-lysine exporter family protein LysE/ArgO
MVLMGSIGNAQGDPARWWFVLGGALASIAWFFLLGYGARALTRFFATQRSWQVLDWIVAAIMLVIAARLIFGGIGV